MMKCCKLVHHVERYQQTWQIGYRWSVVIMYFQQRMHCCPHIKRDIENTLIFLMHAWLFIKFDNFGTWYLNEPTHLFHPCSCTTQRVFEQRHVNELSFHMGIYTHNYMYCTVENFGGENLWQTCWIQATLAKVLPSKFYKNTTTFVPPTYQYWVKQPVVYWNNIPSS